MGINYVMGFKWVVLLLRATSVKLLMMLWVHHRVLRCHLVFQRAIILGRAMPFFCLSHVHRTRLSPELHRQRVPYHLLDF